MAKSVCSLRAHSGGCSNRLYKCTINGDKSTSVLFRLYGTEAVPASSIRRTQTESSLAAVFIIISEALNCPRLLGLFDGGRIEQFIESRTLTRCEARSDHINGIIARKLAKLHSLEMPVVKQSKCPVQVSRQLLDLFDASKSEKLDRILPKDKTLADEVLEFDFVEALDWLISVRVQFDSPLCFCHQDLHLNNMLLKLSAKEDALTDNDILLIDYDNACYNQRATDMGSHFFHRVFLFGSKQVVRPDGVSTDREKKVFIEEYLAELVRIREDRNTPLHEKFDTIEQLTLEVDFYEAGMCMVVAAWMLQFRDFGDANFEVWQSIKGCCDLFVAKRSEFIEKYPNLV